MMLLKCSYVLLLIVQAVELFRIYSIKDGDILRDNANVVNTDQVVRQNVSVNVHQDQICANGIGNCKKSRESHHSPEKPKESDQSPKKSKESHQKKNDIGKGKGRIRILKKSKSDSDENRKQHHKKSSGDDNKRKKRHFHQSSSSDSDNKSVNKKEDQDKKQKTKEKKFKDEVKPKKSKETKRHQHKSDKSDKSDKNQKKDKSNDKEKHDSSSKEKGNDNVLRPGPAPLDNDNDIRQVVNQNVGVNIIQRQKCGVNDSSKKTGCRREGRQRKQGNKSKRDKDGK